MTKSVQCGKGHEYTEENTYIKPNGQRQCKSCRLDSQRHSVLFHKYGISWDDVMMMHVVQDGRCGICLREISEELKNMVVDHDHETDEVRGLLCRWCNVGLGHFQDEPQLLQNAVSYLERSRPEYQI